MTSLTRIAQGDAPGCRQGSSRACEAYQLSTGARYPFSMTGPILAQPPGRTETGIPRKYCDLR